MRWDWQDARIFLAVATLGSTAAAARRLGVAQTTCARRIDALEAALGLTLFDRSATRFVLNETGRLLLPAAGEMEEAAERLEAAAGQAGRAAHIVLRVSAADLLAHEVVEPALDRFRRSWPDVRIELAVEARFADIAAGDADIALRADFAPTDAELVARRLAPNPLAVYCTPAYADRHGEPRDYREFVARPFALLAGRMADAVAAAFPDRPPRLLSSSFRTLIEAVSSGDFAAMLPCLHADRIAGLVRCFLVEADTGSIWLLYNRRLRGRPYVRDLNAAIADSFRAWARGAPGV